MDTELKEAYSQAFQELPETCEAEALLLEINQDEWPRDFDASNLRLLRPYGYKMGQLDAITMMVRRGDKRNQISSSVYNLLRSIRHPSLLPVKNYYRGVMVGLLSQWLMEHYWDGCEVPMALQCFREMVFAEGWRHSSAP